MTNVIKQRPENFNQSKIHPHKVALWIAIGGIIMMFGAFTSAYIVRRAQGNWLEFKLPDIFFLNTVVVVLSSLAVHFSFKSFVRGNENLYKILMVLAFLLGILFIVFQYRGWQEMSAIGATFTANPSSSFVYVISGLHAAHVLGGLGALTMALVHAFYLPFKPTLRRKTRFDLIVTYWHFVTILWIYLLVFFIWQS